VDWKMASWLVKAGCLKRGPMLGCVVGSIQALSLDPRWDSVIVCEPEIPWSREHGIWKSSMWTLCPGCCAESVLGLSAPPHPALSHMDPRRWGSKCQGCTGCKVPSQGLLMQLGTWLGRGYGSAGGDWHLPTS
jgi:hypothetical protein